MEDEQYQQPAKKIGKLHNTLPLWGNEASMNLNPLILANIQGSSYFKVHLFKLKTYHEVVDEIYYQVKHTEPWERGSRKTSGQTGMCGGVRGVGAGGIVSTAFCLLYKLYTLKLTRKQVNGLLNHTDSPYIRALGFMYLRFTQPPADLYDWYEDYFQDEEEIDVKAGGGQIMTIGQMVYQFLTKLDWFSTLFPRIPVPIQKQIEKKLEKYCRDNGLSLHQLGYNSNIRGGVGMGNVLPVENEDDGRRSYAEEEYERRSRGSVSRAPPSLNYRSEHDDREPYRERRRDYAYDDYKERVRDYERARDRYREREIKHSRDRESVRSREREHNSRDREVYRSREREREAIRRREQESVRSREREQYRRDYDVDRRDDYDRERVRVTDEEKERHRDKHKKKKHKHHRSRSRSQGKRESKRDRESARDNGDDSLAAKRRYR